MTFFLFFFFFFLGHNAPHHPLNNCNHSYIKMSQEEDSYIHNFSVQQVWEKSKKLTSKFGDHSAVFPKRVQVWKPPLQQPLNEKQKNRNASSVISWISIHWFLQKHRLKNSLTWNFLKSWNDLWTMTSVSSDHDTDIMNTWGAEKNEIKLKI